MSTNVQCGRQGKTGALACRVMTVRNHDPCLPSISHQLFLVSLLHREIYKTMSPTYAPYPPLDNCPPGVQPHICVNGFSFCFRHGEEHCIRCPFEFRYMNNFIIQDDLEEIISERLSDVRRMLVFSVIASPTLFFFFCRSVSL